MLAAQSRGHTAIWSVPPERSGLVTRHGGFNTVPLDFGRQYVWSQYPWSRSSRTAESAELAARSNDGILIWSDVSST